MPTICLINQCKLASGTAVVNDDIKTNAIPEYLRHRKTVNASPADSAENNNEGEESLHQISDTVVIRTVVDSSDTKPTRTEAPPEGKLRMRNDAENGAPINTKRFAVFIPTVIARSVNLFKGLNAPPLAAKREDAPPFKPEVSGPKQLNLRRISQYLPNDR